MTPSRVIRILSLLLLLAALPSVAMGATTEFRVFFDVDADVTTGCTVGGFDGVEQVLVTQVTDDDTSPRVTRTHRQICTGGILGGATDVVTSGWPAAWRSGDRMLTLETRIPFSSFGTVTPESLHVGFDATRGAAVHAALENSDGTDVLIPGGQRRRRSVGGEGPPRMITMDGLLADWGNIKPVLFGIPGGGSKALRLLRILSYANSADSHIYFAAQLHISSDAPFADEDEYLREPGQEVAVPAGAGVLKNDGDPNGLPLTATKVSEAARGTVTLNPDGSFTYSPNNPASHLTDEFEYKATNGTIDSNVARVRIKVNLGENPKAPVDDEYSTKEDTTLTVPSPGVLDNDPKEEKLVAALFTAPQHGTVTLNADGGFTYKPKANFFGTDTFVYTASKESNGNPVGNATVTITVESVNDTPDLHPATFSVAEHAPNGTVVGTVNVTDPDRGDNHTFTILSGNTGGAFAINSNGTITVANSSAINWAVQSTYSLSVRVQDDGSPSRSNTEIITINVVNENDPPVANPDTASVNEDATLTVPVPGVLANDSDPDGASITAVLVSGPSNGTLTLNPNGSYTYTPNPNFNGTDTFTYRASDGTNQSAPTTVTITVNSVNDVPVAAADAYSTNEDVVLNVPAPGVLGNDSDVESPLTAVLVTGTTNGTLTLNPNGSFTYTPNTNYNGSDSFTYKANDGTADSNTVTVTITVNGVNDVPVAVADVYATNEDTALNVPAPGVLGNDADVEGSTLTAVLVTGPANGTLTLNANGSFSYTPNANYNGVDTFTYKANDGAADSNTVTVTITVNAVNDTPVAVADAYATNEDVALNVPAPGVLGNDTDVDGTPLTAVLVSGPSNGTLTLNPNGSFTYTPNANYSGADSFTYKANDGLADSNTVAVSITVNAVNDAPVAVADAYATNEDVALNVAAPGVLANDSDPEGSSLTAILVSGPANGALTLNADGSFNYTPNANFNGTDTFTYKANDGAADSNTVTVTITVNPINDAPVATADAYATNEDVALNVPAPGVLGNDTDAEGSSLTAVLVSGPANGTLTLNANGSFTYTPNANYNGSDSFTYKANDGSLDSNTVTVTLTVNSVNDVPVAVADAYATDEDTTLNVAAPGVLGNDADVEGSSLTAVLVTGPANGSLTLNANGSFSYTPNANYNGSDSFTYRANDGTDNSNVVTVTITINPINDAPVAVADAYSTNEDVQLNVTAPGVLGNDADVEGSSLTAVLVTGPANGSLTLNADGSFSYTPNANYNGSDSFTYKANDGTLDSNTVTVTITVNSVNDIPVAVADAYATDEDTPLNVAAPGVLANDTDADGTLTAVLVSGPANGSLTLNANGSFTYTPNANYNGSDGFTYKANDGTTDSNTVSVTITVNAVNDAPVAVADAYSTDEDTVLNVPAPGVLANDSDAEGSSLTAVLVSGPANGSLTLNANGSFTYTPNANYNGSDSFTYKANDGTLDSNTVTVTLTVNSVNDLPVAVADAYATNEDTPLNVAAPGVLANDTDADGTLTAVLVSGPANGSLTLNADGSFSYTPNANYNGSDSFTYKANDGTADSNTVTVTLTINAVNDAPVAVADAYSTDEDAALNVAAPGVLGNDSDVESSSLTAVLVSGPANGSLTLNANGSFTYTPNANYNGSDSFTYKANDGTLDSNTVTVTLTVNSVNDTPVAVADAYATNEDVTLNVPAPGVLTNDTDPDNTLTAVLVSGTTNGSLTLNADGSFSYTPNANYSGSDSFTYKANDGTTDSNTVTVTITVNAVNDAPAAVNDTYSTNEDVALNVPAPGVLTNDTDPEGSSLTAVLVTGPANGSLTLNANGSFTYTPNANYNGSDSFTYKANDGTADSNVATVTITVNSVNDTPVAVNDTYATNEDVTLNVPAPGVLANDTDPDNSLTAILVSGTSNGSLTLNANGSFSYTPNANYSGSDSFTYKANDGTTDSNTVTVTITVNAVNDVPVAVADAYSTDEDVALNVAAPGVLANDSDVESSLTAVLVTGPANGTLTLNANGSFTYTPNANYNGSDTFTYKANDGTADSNTATVTITVNSVPDIPVAVADAYSVDEDTVLNVPAPGVLSNDTDTDGDALTAAVVSTTTNGTLTLNPNGSFTYVPNANYNGTDTFTYRANDGTGDSNVATVTITVNPVNDPPDLPDATRAVNENSANGTNVGAALPFTDPDTGQSYTFAITAGNTGGAFAVSNSGQITVANSAQLNYEATQQFVLTVQITDNGTPTNLSDTATVTINVNDVNEAPVAGADAMNYIGNTELRADGHAGTANALAFTTTTVNPIDNDTDPDTLNPAFSSLSIVPAGPTTTSNGGVYRIEADGTMYYTPPAGYTGTDTVPYTLTDGTNNTSGSITMTMTGTDVVWYVRNNDPTADAFTTNNGTSSDPFNTLLEAETASGTNHIIYVHVGNGTSSGQNAGITLKQGQDLIGNGVALVVNGSTTLIAAGTRPSIGNAAGDGVTVLNTTAHIVRGLNITGSDDGVSMNTTGASAGGIEIADNTISGTTNFGVRIAQASTGSSTVSVHDNTLSGGSAAMDIARTAGSLTITAFDDLTVPGTSPGGIVVTGAGGVVLFDAIPGGGADTVSGGITTIGTSVDRISNSGLVLLNVQGALSYTDLDIFTDANAALVADGGGTGFTFTVTPGASTIVANAGGAVAMTDITGLNLQLAAMTSTNSAAEGVSLVNTTGTFSAPSSSSITNATGTAFNISGGTVNSTYNGTIYDNTGTIVAVATSTGGTKIFGGAIDDLDGTGDPIAGGAANNGGGITLTNNTGATIRFTGGVDLSTGAATAFNATGGGTVEVCDEAVCNAAATGTLVNRLSSTTGIALNVANTTIGANDLEFRSISANGASSGIVLNTTGSSGNLAVKGNGGTCSSAATCTGGAIQNTSGHGISLTNTTSPSFDRMFINSTGGSGVNGTTVTNFTFTNGKIDNSGQVTDADESNIAFNTSGGTNNNIAGTVTITGNSLTNAAWHGIDILNFSGTVADMNISNNTVTSATSTATSKGTGIRIQSIGSATTASTLTKATISTNTVSNFPSGSGIRISGGNAGTGPGGTAGTPGNATNVIAITNNTVSGQSAANRIGSSAILAEISGGNSGSRSQGNFSITGNILSHTGGHTLGAGVNGYATGTFDTSSNTIVSNNSVASNGISGGVGIVTSTAETGDMTWTINNNNISQTDGSGILGVARGTSGTLKVAIKNNTVAAPLTGARSGIRVDAGNATSLDDSVCADIQNNTSGASGGVPGISIRKQGTVATTNDFGLEGLSPSPATYNQAEDYVASLNPGSVLGLAFDGGSKRTLVLSGNNFVSCSTAP